ncbi:hypothetical protein WDU94_011283 [Cyamophila willieti]
MNKKGNIKDEPVDEYASFLIKEESLDIIDVREETVEDDLIRDEIRVREEFGEEYITDDSYHSGYNMEEDSAHSRQSSTAGRCRKSKYNKVPPSVMSEALAEIKNGAKFAATSKKYNISEGVLRYQAKRQESRNLTLFENDKKAMVKMPKEDFSDRNSILIENDEHMVITPEVDFAISEPQSRLQLKYEPSSPGPQHISEDFDIGASVTIGTVPVSYEKKYTKVPQNIMREALAEIERGAKVSKTAKKYNISDAVLRYQVKKEQSRSSSWVEKEERSAVKAIEEEFALSQFQSTIYGSAHRKKIKLQPSSSTSEYPSESWDTDPSLAVHCEVTLQENGESLDAEDGMADHAAQGHINHSFNTSQYSSSDGVHYNEDNDKNPYSCNSCTKRFSRRGDLQRHYTEVHDDIRYPCIQCAVTFTRKSNLQAHMMSMHVGIKNIHSCPECEKTFTRKSDLGRHLAIHRGVKFTCTECPKSLIRNHLCFAMSKCFTEA